MGEALSAFDRSSGPRPARPETIHVKDFRDCG
jgi:hypothetical protein